jgi:hypothetical protein
MKWYVARLWYNIYLYQVDNCLDWDVYGALPRRDFLAFDTELECQKFIDGKFVFPRMFFVHSEDRVIMDYIINT